MASNFGCDSVPQVAGMANATGIDYNTLIHVSLFPELIRMSCSMFGAWGPATAHTSSGLVQLRALDWSTDGPFQQYPVVVVYHPSEWCLCRWRLRVVMDWECTSSHQMRATATRSRPCLGLASLAPSRATRPHKSPFLKRWVLIP
jgi:hypothetical protein